MTVTATEPVVRQSLSSLMAAIDLAARQGSVPFDPVKESDRVIGVLGEELQRIYFVTEDVAKQVVANSQRIREEGGRVIVSHLELHSTPEAKPHDCDDFQKKLDGLKAQFDTENRAKEAAHNLFWGAVRLEFPEINSEESLTIREGWQLVSERVETPPFSLTELLRGFAGQMSRGH